MFVDILIKQGLELQQRFSYNVSSFYHTLGWLCG